VNPKRDESAAESPAKRPGKQARPPEAELKPPPSTPEASADTEPAKPPVLSPDPPPVPPSAVSTLLRAGSPSPAPQIDLSAVAKHSGSCVSVFVSAVSDLLFKDGLTLSPGESLWGALPKEAPQLNQTRRNLLNALVRVFSVGALASPPRFVALPLIGFPFAKLITNVANVSFRYLEQVHAGKTDQFTVPLLKSGFTLCVQLFDRADFRSAFSEIKRQRLVRSFALSAVGVPVFEPLSPLANEAVSFLYTALVLQPSIPQFLAVHLYSNTFVFYLISAAELVFEKSGFSFVHTLLFSSIIRIVAEPKAAAALNAPRAHDLQFAFQPPPGSYGDLLLNIAVHVCQSEGAWTWAARIFHAIAPFISHVSLQTGFGVLSLFEQASAADSSAMALFLDGFAAVVQRSQPPENGLIVAIFQRARTFRTLKVPQSSGRALGVILAFLMVARKLARAEQKSILTAEEAAQLFAQIEIAKSFPQTQAFTRKEPELADRLPGWREWSDNLARPGKIIGLDCLWSP
jgi:hypothetical protein